jgi:RNA polymerase sigma-70 factor (ECF subfamily)
VTQDAFTRVAKTIQDFESNPNKGSFRCWLMNLTRWRVTDKFWDRSMPRRPQHFQIFDLHVRQQWTVLRVSRELGVNAASVCLVTHCLTKQMKEEVEKLKTTLD